MSHFLSQPEGVGTDLILDSQGAWTRTSSTVRAVGGTIRKHATWGNLAKASTAAAFGACVVASAGVCLGAGLASAGLSTYIDHRYGINKNWKKNFAKQAILAGAGYGVARGFGSIFARAGLGARVTTVGRHARSATSRRVSNGLMHGRWRTRTKVRAPHISTYAFNLGVSVVRYAFGGIRLPHLG